MLIFSIAMDANYSFYVKTIETDARSFFKVIIFSIGSVVCPTLAPSWIYKKMFAFIFAYQSNCIFEISTLTVIFFYPNKCQTLRNYSFM